jgi:D-amino-acid dehydrogenase
MNETADVIVLGAGIVGISAAIQLQRRGRRVVVIDRGKPGRETSFGNAGVVQTEAVLPYMFPRKLGELARYALNLSDRSFYHASTLPSLLKPFAEYWRNSSAVRTLEIAVARAPLILRAGEDHLEMARLAGASDLLHPTGWSQLFNDPKSLDEAWDEAELLTARFGVPVERIEASALDAHVPGLMPGLTGAIHYPTPRTVRDPIDLIMAYLKLFKGLGGVVRTGDAQTLARGRSEWKVSMMNGVASAPKVVVALGPWATDLTSRFGYRPPMFMKRGYHMHFEMPGYALARPVLDTSNGYFLAPMRNGVRLTTGAEFASRDSRPTPVQLNRAEPKARRLFPALGRRLDTDPWLGSRPCLPDMLPIIGPAPNHPNLWYLFGHAHQGFTLGPTTGRLLAEMMVGDETFTDPAPFRAERFRAAL